MILYGGAFIFILGFVLVQADHASVNQLVVNRIKDVNKCDTKEASPCTAPIGDCVNVGSTWRCNCRAGYKNAQGNDKICKDVNECKTGEASSCTAPVGNCVNLVPMWRCNCSEGYKNAQGNNEICEDVNECDTGEASSCTAPEGNCVNLDPMWRCNCSVGYQNAEGNDQICEPGWSCNKTFVRETPASNSVTLADSSLLLDTIPEVTSVDYCEGLCCLNDLCCKAIFTEDSGCLLYKYLPDTLLPIPEGATLLREECCYIMGDITLRFDKKNADDAQAACQADGMTLAMPKTECAFQILEEIAEANRAQAGNILWVGMTNPTGTKYIFYDGDTPEAHGFVLPLGPAAHVAEHEKQGIFYYVNGAWTIGDWEGYQIVSFICQTNTYNLTLSN